MIDRRRCPSCTGVSPSRAVRTPTASGPRWAIRSTMARTSCSPSGCPNAPATPHTSILQARDGEVDVGRTPDARRLGVREGDDARLRHGHPADELVVDLDVRGALVRPPERALDPGAGDVAHGTPPRRVVEELDDGARVAVDVAVRQVDRGVLGGDPGLLEVERDDRQPE